MSTGTKKGKNDGAGSNYAVTQKCPPKKKIKRTEVLGFPFDPLFYCCCACDCFDCFETCGPFSYKNFTPVGCICGPCYYYNWCTEDKKSRKENPVKHTCFDGCWYTLCCPCALYFGRQNKKRVSHNQTSTAEWEGLRGGGSGGVATEDAQFMDRGDTPIILLPLLPSRHANSTHSAQDAMNSAL